MSQSSSRGALAAVGLAALCIVSCLPAPAPQAAGDVLTFALPDLDGRIVRFSDSRFTGRVVLVDIWGTWCDPCRRSVPFFVELQERYRDDGLEIVGIAFENPTGAKERRNLLRKAIEQYGINYTLLDGGTTKDVQTAIPDITRFHGFPSIFLLDRDGRVVYTKTGFFPREKGSIEGRVRRALGL